MWVLNVCAGCPKGHSGVVLGINMSRFRLSERNLGFNNVKRKAKKVSLLHKAMLRASRGELVLFFLLSGFA